MTYSLTIPGIVLAKSVFALSTTPTNITLPTVTGTASRRANAVMINYINNTIDVYINIDGTAAGVGFGFRMNSLMAAATSWVDPNEASPADNTVTGTIFNPQPLQQLILYGLPRNLSGVSASGTPSIEVYILSVPEWSM